MIKRSILLTSLLGGAMFATSVAAPAVRPGKTLVAKAAVAAPLSRAEARSALEDSVAASLVGAIAEQFGENDVEVRIDQMRIDAVSIAGRDVRGQGRLQFGKSGEIPFEFQALYDTVTTQVARPALVIGAPDREAEIAKTSPAANALLAKVRGQIEAEFAQQAPQVKFERFFASQVSAGLQRIDAQGSTLFPGEDSVKTTATALYEARSGKLLHVAYALGTESNWEGGGPDPRASVAIR